MIIWEMLVLPKNEKTNASYMFLCEIKARVYFCSKSCRRKTPTCRSEPNAYSTQQVKDTESEIEESAEEGSCRSQDDYKPKRNWNIGTHGKLIWGPHLLLLVAILEKTRYWDVGNSFLASSQWSTHPVCACLSLFQRKTNCNCILKYCVCACVRVWDPVDELLLFLGRGRNANS